MSSTKDSNLTDARTEIRAWLAKVAPSLSELYEGAVRMVLDPGFPGRTRLIAHAVREICNRLPEVLGGTTKQERLDYAKRLSVIDQEWAKVGLPLPSIGATEEVPSSPPEINVPLHLYQLFATLVAEHRSVGDSQFDKAFGLFEGLAPVDQAAGNSLRPVVAQWRSLTQWFVQRAHDNNHVDCSARYSELDSKFMLLELTLASLVRGFFHSVDVLDEILKQDPTPEQVERAIANLIHPQHRRYFFDRLDNPIWVEPLKQRKFFDSPPQAVRDEVAGTVRYPPWPEGGYLARAAAHAPEAVRTVMLGMPETDNVYVHNDLIAAALKMPTAMLRDWVQRETAWVKKQQHLFVIPESLGKLATHLASGGLVDSALSLLRALLRVIQDPREAEGGAKFLLPSPRGLVDNWEYQELLKVEFPQLTKGVGVRALLVLVDLLHAAVILSERPESREEEEDYSHTWCEAIANIAWDDRHGIRDLLLIAVREVAIQLLEEGTAITDIVAATGKKRQKIFRRLEYFIMSQKPEDSPGLLLDLLVSREHFTDSDIRTEYRSLLSAGFGLLKEEARNEILAWIDNGPDLDVWARNFEAWEGRPPTKEQIGAVLRKWEYEWLSVIAGHLSGDRKAYYESFPPVVDQSETMAQFEDGWVEVPSPITVDMLKAMEIEELITFLSTWQPDRQHAIFGTSGLERELSSAVAQEPTKFSTHAPKFCAAPLHYGRTVLSALREAVKRGVTIEWEPTLALCCHVLARSQRDQDKVLSQSDQERSWERAAIADLLYEAFGDTQTSLPANLRKQAWDILSVLTQDPNPSAGYETKYGEGSMDPATLSLNTVRGQAMHAVIRYALWVRRHHLKTLENPDGSESLEFLAPEVKDVLELHLDPARDGSVSVRAVYGQWYPWLVVLSEVWARDHSTAIFSLPDPESVLAQAAWNTYLTFNMAYSNVAPLVYQQYELAVERLAASAPDHPKRLLREPTRSLAEHIVTLSWRRLPDMQKWDALLERFWQLSPDALRHHAVEYIGRSLCNTKEPVAHTVLDWLKTLWEHRLAAVKDRLQEGHDELCAFGWWFSSTFFDEEWKLSQLEGVLGLVGRVDNDRRVVEILASLTNQYPSQVLNCLALLVQGAREGWHLSIWEENIRLALSRSMSSKDSVVRAQAIELIHEMGGKGYLGFHSLLKENPDSE